MSGVNSGLRRGLASACISARCPIGAPPPPHTAPPVEQRRYPLPRPSCMQPPTARKGVSMLIYGREGPWAIPLVLVEKGHWGARDGGAALYPLSPTPRTTQQSLTTRGHHDYQRDGVPVAVHWRRRMGKNGNCTRGRGRQYMPLRRAHDT